MGDLTAAASMLHTGVPASPDESGLCKFILVCKEVKSLYLLFVPHLFTKFVTHQFLWFFFLSQAVDDSGVPGMDRVDSMAEYLVELRHQLSLALTNQQVRNIYCLTTFPLCPVIHIHTHVFVFSHGLLCSLSLSRWDLILNDYRRIRRRILDNGAVMQQTTLQLVDVSHTTQPGTVAQQEGVEAGQRGGARTGLAKPLVCGD